MYLYLIAIFILAYLIFANKKCENFQSKPNATEIQKYKSDIMSNKELFQNQTLRDVQKKLPWIDPITFEDVRHLANNNNFHHNTVEEILVL